MSYIRFNNYRRENVAPYSLFGDSNGNYAVHARLSNFPNPVENDLFLTMHGEQSQEEYQILITDLTGNILYSGVHQGSENMISLDSYTFNTGVYIVKFVQSNYSEVHKIFKK